MEAADSIIAEDPSLPEGTVYMLVGQIYDADDAIRMAKSQDDSQRSRAPSRDHGNPEDPHQLFTTLCRYQDFSDVSGISTDSPDHVPHIRPVEGNDETDEKRGDILQRHDCLSERPAAAIASE